MKLRMFDHLNNAVKFLTATALAFSLCACLGGGSTEPTRYYTVAVEDIQMPRMESTQKRLLVKKFTIENAYQRTNIVYRESPYDFMFYDLDLWASRPEQMLTQASAEYLSKCGLFKAVDVKTQMKPDLEFAGHILAIEEIDEGSKQYAHLALQLTLRKVDGQEPLWEASFDEKSPMSDREPRTTAESISKLMAKFMEKALESIGAASTL